MSNEVVAAWLILAVKALFLLNPYCISGENSRAIRTQGPSGCAGAGCDGLIHRQTK